MDTPSMGIRSPSIPMRELRTLCMTHSSLLPAMAPVMALTTALMHRMIMMKARTALTIPRVSSTLRLLLTSPRATYRYWSAMEPRIHTLATGIQLSQG